jgi:transketolase
MNEDCRKVRKDILEISHTSGHGHIPSCFSVVECLYGVYDTIRHFPQDPKNPERDIFILSKGHAALAHYCVLAHHGYFDVGDVKSFGSYCADFGCHADRFKVSGVEVSTGSLGHGIGLAVGMALAFKIRGNARRVFTLIGDGESNEGSVWEAVMVAVNERLSNLTIIYDNNVSQTRGLQISNPRERFNAFGCNAVDINGHDLNEVKQELRNGSDRVKVIVANTKKGFGSKTLMDNFHAWHRRSPSEDEFKVILGELDA